ncbi:MAG TPA: fasciclin domain-containing protein [Bacteroidales bacterium]
MKNSIRKFQLILVALAAVAIFASCNKDEDPAPMQTMNIAETASTDSRFTILAEALTKAGLVSALEGPGPFTVFAPTNDAFNALFADLGVSGLADLSAETLKPILLNHVIGAKVMAADVTTGYAATLNNTAPNQNNVMVYINVSNGVMVDGSKVIVTDVEASNGVIHAIDKVILPASVVNHAINNPNFSILVQAVVKANLVDALSAEGPYTVFAPTNTAFEALFSALKVDGINALTAEQLSPILLYHVVSGNVLASQVTSGMVPTLNGKDLTVVANGSGVSLNETTNVIATDVQGTNGVIHVIDAVLLP